MPMHCVRSVAATEFPAHFKPRSNLFHTALVCTILLWSRNRFVSLTGIFWHSKSFRLIDSVMHFRISTNRLLRLVGMFLTTVVVVCLIPTSVQASCGDYVTVSGLKHGHSMTSSSHATKTYEALAVPQRAPVKRPCQGPNCSKRHSAPPIAPTTVLRLVLDQWAVLFGEALTDSHDEIAVPVTNPSMGFATSQVSRIYRPPR